MINTHLEAICLSAGVILEPLTLVKPGNVSRLVDLPDMGLRHFTISALAFPLVLKDCIVDSMEERYRIGYRILQLVRYATQIHGVNTCLGTAILHVPLAYALPRAQDVEHMCELATEIVREHTSVEDTVYFYDAVRLVMPSYVAEKNPLPHLPDVRDPDYREKIIKMNLTLYRLLEECSKIDLVCRQLVSSYCTVLEAKRLLEHYLNELRDPDLAIAATYLHVLAEYGDTMVAREHGEKIHEMVRTGARETLNRLLQDRSVKPLLELDQEFRKYRINPGTTADIIACTISLTVTEQVIFRKSQLTNILITQQSALTHLINQLMDKEFLKYL